MEIVLRDYALKDAPAIIAVFRDSLDSLRKSKGGMHPDSYVDGILKQPDDQILSRLTYGNLMVVAVVRATGEIVGMSAITKRWKHRLISSTYSTTCMSSRNSRKAELA